MKTYPIMLNVTGKVAVVVGGGPVALRKTRSLLQANAHVRLIAPQCDLPANLHVEWIKEEYRPEHLHGAFLTFACTNNNALNAQIAQDAHEQGILVNLADAPEACDFHVPAVVCDEDVTVAVSTCGASPSLAGWLKDTISGALPEQAGPFARLLAGIRRELPERVADCEKRGAIVRELSSRQSLELFCKKGPQAILDRLESLVEES